jgi:Beta-1,3-glucanase
MSSPAVRRLLASFALALACAQADAQPAPAKADLVYRFVNATGGKFADADCFWSMNNGKDWTSFAAKPTAPIHGNGRVYFRVGEAPKNLDDRSKYWDFIEYNFAKGTWYGNTTQVDAFCIPITIELGDKRFGITEPRSRLFDEFRKQCPAEFKECVKGDTWILSPCRAGFGDKGPSAHYFDKYVDEVWSQYAKRKLTPSSEFYGEVVGEALTFTQARVDGKPVTFTCKRKPTTQEIFLGTGVLGQNPAFCAAFNRHVAADPADWRDAAKFYAQEPCNWCSKFLHEHSIDKKAYGFCYDDYADQATYFSGKGPELVVTLYWDGAR